MSARAKLIMISLSAESSFALPPEPRRQELILGSYSTFVDFYLISDAFL